MGLTPYRPTGATHDESWDPRQAPPFRAALPLALCDLRDGYADDQARMQMQQMSGFWDVVAKVAPVAGAVAGLVAGGPAGAAAGFAGGSAAAALIKGKAKEAIAKAEEATGYDIPPQAEAIAEAIIGNGGTVEEATAEVARRVVSANIGDRVRQAAVFAGDNSALRGSLVSMKTGKALPLPARAPVASAYTGGDSGYSTRLYSQNGAVPLASSSAVQATAPTPIYKNPLVLGAAVALLAGGYFYMHQGRR